MATKKKSAARSLYSVHPSVDYANSIIRNLPEKTGHSLEQWIQLLDKSGPADEKARRDWLKKQYKLGGTTAWLIAELSAGKGQEGVDPDAYLAAAPEYVEAMYAGPKQSLRPLHDALVKLGQSLGKDVKICPCATIVPFYREHVFAQIKPTTRTRIDFGLALKDTRKKPGNRLIDTGGLAKGDRITHRIPITSLDDIDDEVQRWAAEAYALDAVR